MYKINDFVIVNDYHVYQVVQVNQFYYTLSSLINPHTINVDSTSIIKRVHRLITSMKSLNVFLIFELYKSKMIVFARKFIKKQ